MSQALVTHYGWGAYTIDNHAKFKPSVVADIRTWDYRTYVNTHGVPDVIWCSPPCRTFSLACWGKHRDAEGRCTSVAAKEGDECVRACMRVIDYCVKRCPRVVWFIENPFTGAFRKLDCVQPYLSRGQYRVVNYGDYSDRHSLKPTIILTNCTAWRPKPRVLKKSTRHYNRLSKKQRTILPDALCNEIAESIVKQLVA